MGTNANPKKVLVVEDDPCINELLQTILAEEGYQPVAAYDGAEALTLAREMKPSLITLDLALPEADGYQVLETLKSDETLKHIPVIVLSAYTDNLFRTARKLASRVVEKPFDLGQLLDAVATAA